MRKLALILLLAASGCAVNPYLSSSKRAEFAQEQATVKRMVSGGKISHRDGQKRLADKFVALFGHHTDTDAILANRIYLAGLVDAGKMTEDEATARDAEYKRQVELGNRVANAQQQAAAAAMLGAGANIMQANQPRMNPVINCNSIQQGAYINTNCQ